MRPVFFLICLVLAFPGTAQVLINEVQCARIPGTDGEGPDGDWVELFNAGRAPVDLGGHILAMGMRMVRIQPDRVINPGEHRVFWCGRDQGPDHLAIKLSWRGGSLLLVAPDGMQVLDMFSWPTMAPGVSLGRVPDGGQAWGFMTAPTPGGSNGKALPRSLPPPVIVQQGDRLVITGAVEAELRFTTDGSEPQQNSRLYEAPIAVLPGMVLRTRAFAHDAVASGDAVFVPALNDGAWALVVAPEDLTGPEGIANVRLGNHARSGKAWQRKAWVQHGGSAMPIGLSIAGSGSRSLPKRSYKLEVRDRFGGEGLIGLPDGGYWKNVMLRADGSPNAFLRNAFMEEVAHRGGNKVDVQPAMPVPLYLNGEFQGLYRVMPAKGNEWLGSLNAGGPVDIVEGPAAVAVRGSAKAYRHALDALRKAAPIDSLARLMDLESLVELACYDLWTGRADHEMNVRAWRPRRPDGRWRWVLYDMDMWSAPDDRTVHRMAAPVVPEAPFLTEILAHPDLQRRLLARLAALCATSLSPEHAIPMLDSLLAQHRGLMERDHRRWSEELNMPLPDDGAELLRKHISRRADYLFKELADQVGRSLYTITVQVEPAGSGHVELEQLPLDDGQKLKVFGQVPLRFRAVAKEGMEFAGWKGNTGEPEELLLSPNGDRRLTALFRPAGLSSQGGLHQRLKQQPPVGVAQ